MTIVIKLGGKALEKEERMLGLFAEIKRLQDNRSFILVHGGGADVTAVSRKFGIEAVFKDGIRQTSEAEMDIVDMVLSGRINKKLVRLCRAGGLNAAGVSCSDGGVVIGTPVGGSGDNRTGEIRTVDPKLIETLLSGGFLPVVSPACTDEEGGGLNVNADSAAFALASALEADAMVFFSDIPGILKNGRVMPELSGEQARSLIAEGVISGGMIPKVTSSLEAIKHGVKRVIIGEYTNAGDLEKFLNGSAGTRIRP
jgi:acetylglutamate kinase